MKRIFFLILLAVMSTGIYAQTDDKGYKEGAWVLNGVTGLNLSQTAMTLSLIHISEPTRH